MAAPVAIGGAAKNLWTCASRSTIVAIQVRARATEPTSARKDMPRNRTSVRENVIASTRAAVETSFA